MKIQHRIQTWAADHFSAFQYPHIKATPKIDKPELKVDMPTRVIMGVVGFWLLLISTALMIACLFALCVMALTLIDAIF